MLDVGLIGLGPEWEHRYRPALFNLRHRMRVRVIQSAVWSLAEQTAVEWRCEPAHGVLAAVERPDVRAVLILDAAWYGPVPAEFACVKGKPAFLAGRLGQWVAQAGELTPLAAETETPLMPDFCHRYTPATSRLKELIASRLGRPDSIVVRTTAAEASAVGVDFSAIRRDALLASLDWACHLIGTAPAEVRGTTTATGDDEAVVAFAQSKAGGGSPIAQIQVCRQPSPQPDWSAEVRCRKGSVSLRGGTQIEWRNGADRHSELLTAERSGVEVMLDHFSRRVVGGLIPVPTLEDLCRAAQLADAAIASRQTGKPVPVE